MRFPFTDALFREKAVAVAATEASDGGSSGSSSDGNDGGSGGGGSGNVGGGNRKGRSGERPFLLLFACDPRLFCAEINGFGYG